MSDLPENNEPAASLAEVSWSFEEGSTRRNVLDNVSLDLHHGDWISVTGPSGSGKSTLLNILAGIEIPDSGRVLMDGSDFFGLSEHKRTLIRRQRLGFIFQFFNLVPTLTVLENLLLPLDLIGQPRNESLACSLLSRFGLEDRRDSFPDVLSGGEQQRIATIRASIHRPDIILADEPTGNLDSRAGDEVLDMMQELVDSGICIVMVTHSSTASSRAGRSYRLEDGNLKSKV